MLTSSRYVENGLTGNNITNATIDGSDEEWRFDDNTQRRLVGTGLLIVCLTGIVGNCLVIAAVSLTLKLQNVTNIFVSNLAVGDLLHCLFLPFMIHDLYQPLYDVMPDPVMCAINGVLTVLFLSVSVFSHALIAVTRYVMITRPRRAFQVLFTPCRILILLSLIWTISSIDPVLSIARVAPLGFNPKYGICSRDIRNRSSIILSLVRSIYTNVFSIVVVLFCYTKVFIFVRSHNNNTLRRILTSSSAGGSTASRKTLEETMVLEDANTSAVRYTKGVDDDEESDGCITSTQETSYKPDDATNDIVAENNTLNRNVTSISYMRVDLTNHEGENQRTVCGDINNDISSAAITPVTVDSKEVIAVRKPDILSHSLPSDNASLIHSNKLSGNCVAQAIIAETNDVPAEYIYSNVYSGDGERCLPACICNDGLPVTYSTGYAHHNCSVKLPGCELHSHARNCSGKPKNKNRKRSSKFSWRWRSRRSEGQPSSQRKEIDITKKLAIVVCVFFACISPYIFFVSLKSLERLLPYAALLQAASPCLNPIIYGLAHPQFQQIFKLIISCQISQIPKPSRFLKWLSKYRVVPWQTSPT